MTNAVIAGQLAAEVLEHRLEGRNDPAEQHGAHDERDAEGDERVDQRAADLTLQLDALLDVDREAIEDGVEDAAHLARANQAAKQLVEHLGVPRQRVRERGALLDVALHVLAAPC